MKTLKGGLYLVVDPKPGLQVVLPKIQAALAGGVDVIQLWNNWRDNEPIEEFVLQVCALAHRFDVPVLMNEQWEYLQVLPLDGIHFDTIPKNFDQIRQKINRCFLTGITCGNDPKEIQWAVAHKLDYISFCSVFPSSTANSCDLVRHTIIQETRTRTNIAIYAAGGINEYNMATLLPLGINGVAIVSGIMNAEDPCAAASRFKQKITTHPANITTL